MTKRCSILQTKLHELETKLHQALLLHDHDDQHRALSEDIKQKFVFIKSLLSAEISSSPQASATPNHLQHMSRRIHNLEDGFLKWHSSRDLSGGRRGEGFEVSSTCSCTESCFNDNGGEARGELCVAEFAEPEDSPVDCMVEWKGEETEAEECPEGVDGEEKKAIVKWEGEEEKKTQKLGSLMIVYEDARDHFPEGEGLVDHGGLVITKESGNNDVILKSVEMTTEEDEEATVTSSEFGHVCDTMAYVCGTLASAVGVVFGMVLMGFMMLGLLGFHFVDEPYPLVPT